MELLVHIANDKVKEIIKQHDKRDLDEYVEKAILYFEFMNIVNK